METQMSKVEKIAILSILILIGVLFISLLFTSVDPKYPTPAEVHNTELELKVENQKLKFLVDSLELVDSLHLIQLKEKNAIIKYKKHEIYQVIKFIPTASSKFKDSLWAVYLTDTVWRDTIK